MSVLTDLRNRGIKDVFFVVCDGLKGLPEVVSNVWPQPIGQTASSTWSATRSGSPPASTGTNSNGTSNRSTPRSMRRRRGPRSMT
jgi:hypothetical protein